MSQEDTAFWKQRLLESYFLEYHEYIEECTCVKCDYNKECEFSYDAYNSNGDCLLDK